MNRWEHFSLEELLSLGVDPGFNRDELVRELRREIARRYAEQDDDVAASVRRRCYAELAFPPVAQGDQATNDAGLEAARESLQCSAEAQASEGATGRLQETVHLRDAVRAIIQHLQPRSASDKHLVAANESVYRSATSQASEGSVARREETVALRDAVKEIIQHLQERP